MEYITTRGIKKGINASEAIVKGLASDGGLFVPTAFQQMDLYSLLNKSYEELAVQIIKPFLNDFTENKVKTIISEAYANTFDTKEITPIHKLNEQEFVLELFHGRTSAFKDVALSLLPYELTSAKDNVEDKTHTLILTATSGDTGKAALEGFKDVPNTSIMVFYPSTGVSPVQERQMITTAGNNTCVCGIEGNFDDAQRAVKEAMNSLELLAFAKENKLELSSANSINIGRLIPQIVYYFYSYLKLVNSQEIFIGEEVNFSVPTGNFGDILAGYIAKQMGLPVHTLICASNKNNVLFEFLSTGVYDANLEFYKTISPSMDILVSSNLERLLYFITKDQDYVNSLMNDLKTTGKYQLKDEYLKEIQKLFYPSFATDVETRKAISDVYKKYNYLMDPHTAVAYKGLTDYLVDSSDHRKSFVLATASPFKFANDVMDALELKKDASAFENLKLLSMYTHLSIPANLANLEELPINHNHHIKKDEIIDFIKDYMVKCHD